MLKFFALFIVLLVALFVAELLPPVQAAVVVPWTTALASISAWLVGIFDPQVISYGKVLQHGSTGVGVSIEAGCNGIEACIILIAGVLAYPAPWRMKLAGIVLGIIAIQAVNILRVISLFYLADWHQGWFEFAHLYLWQVLIMLDVLVVWLLWIRYVARNASDSVDFDDAARA